MVVVVVGTDGVTELDRWPLVREGDDWVGTIGAGTNYGIVADGDAPWFDPSKMLVDPAARDVCFPAGHDRQIARERGVANLGHSPLAVARPPRPPRPPRHSSRTPVIYEAHVRHLTRSRPDHGVTRGADVGDAANGRPGIAPGTYAALAGELDRLATLGVSVIELLPVHQRDPQEGSEWGYMPLVFGAVERRYAATDDPGRELADLVSAAHERDIEVWLDVVFNHTTEVGHSGPTYHLRGLADDEYYRHTPDGGYVETTGCGNDLDTSSLAAQDLVMASLDALADLGVDGFRFDLASVLARHRPFIARLDEWAAMRSVRLIAEAWDAVGTHEVGRAWSGNGWMQWNDHFRDDVRRYLRAEPGLVPSMMQRVQGSPDVFAAPMDSVNFVTCHDGFTMYDVFAYDRKHNDANGQHNTDGANHNHSWNCGWEGDTEAPAEVLALRRRQLRNAWCLLALSHGAPMFVMGDEMGRTQRGNNNAYRVDDPTVWVDWERAAQFADLQRFVGELLALRRRHPVLSQSEWWGDGVKFFGANGPHDQEHDSRTLAWTVGDLYVVANTWWEPLDIWTQVDGPWRCVVDTSLPPPHDIVAAADVTALPVVGASLEIDARSVIVLERVRSPRVVA